MFRHWSSRLDRAVLVALWRPGMKMSPKDLLARCLAVRDFDQSIVYELFCFSHG